MKEPLNALNLQVSYGPLGMDGSNQTQFKHSYTIVFILVPLIPPHTLNKIGSCVNAKPGIVVRENCFVNCLKWVRCIFHLSPKKYFFLCVWLYFFSFIFISWRLITSLDWDGEYM